MQRLKEKVALVTGASRNVGRGIALVLGEEGSTVYVTGRSVRNNQTSELPGANIEDTADRVTELGGKGIPIRCDHSIDEQVQLVFDRIKEEQGRLDILVNNAWGGYETIEKVEGQVDWEGWMAPFWKQPFSRWDAMFNVGVRSHMVASRCAMTLMLEQKQGMIYNTTYDVESSGFPVNAFYWLAKVALNKMTLRLANELREYNIPVIALSPGWIRTGDLLFEHKTDDANAHKIEALQGSESTQFVGRAIVALATDPNIIKKSGQTLKTRELGLEYGFKDTDGIQPQLEE